MTEREAFEAWCADDWGPDDAIRHANSTYGEWEWGAWQACATLKDKRIAELSRARDIYKHQYELEEKDNETLFDKVAELEASQRHHRHQINTMNEIYYLDDDALRFACRCLEGEATQYDKRMAVEQLRKIQQKLRRASA